MRVIRAAIEAQICDCSRIGGIRCGDEAGLARAAHQASDLKAGASDLTEATTVADEDVADGSEGDLVLHWHGVPIKLKHGRVALKAIGAIGEDLSFIKLDAPFFKESREGRGCRNTGLLLLRRHPGPLRLGLRLLGCEGEGVHTGDGSAAAEEVLVDVEFRFRGDSCRVDHEDDGHLFRIKKLGGVAPFILFINC